MAVCQGHYGCKKRSKFPPKSSEILSFLEFYSRTNLLFNFLNLKIPEAFLAIFFLTCQTKMFFLSRKSGRFFNVFLFSKLIFSP